MARTLLETKIGSVGDWRECRADAVAFMHRTVQRSAEGVDRKAIDSVAHTAITFGTNPTSNGWREPDQDADRVFLSVEATRICIVYLKATFDLLGRVNERLPATFYRLLRPALSRSIFCYDEAEAERYIECRLEDYEERQQGGEEGLEKVQSLGEAKGPWLAPDVKPLSRREMQGLLGPLRRDSKAARIMRAATDLFAMSRKTKPHRIDHNLFEDYFPEGYFTLPFAILAFHQGDVVCQSFEADQDGWFSSGEAACPAFVAMMSPNDPRSVKQAFDRFKHLLAMLEQLGKLLALLPGSDLLEVET